jgi:hypothetical protein
MAAIMGELYVDYNGTLTKAFLATDASLVENLDAKLETKFAENVIRNTAENLRGSDSIFDDGTIIYETDTKYFKIADGVTSYNNLEYVNGRNGAGNGLLVEVLQSDGTYDEKGVDDVILEFNT